MSDFTQTLQDWSEISIRRSMHEFTRFMRTQGLSMPQIHVLMHLYHTNGCYVSEISKKLEISRPAASQLIQKLVGHGYLERTEDLNDRRAKYLRITADGQALIQSAIGTRRIWIESLAENLTEAEQATIEKALFMLIGAQDLSAPASAEDDS